MKRKVGFDAKKILRRLTRVKRRPILERLNESIQKIHYAQKHGRRWKRGEWYSLRSLEELRATLAERADKIIRQDQQLQEAGEVIRSRDNALTVLKIDLSIARGDKDVLRSELRQTQEEHNVAVHDRMAQSLRDGGRIAELVRQRNAWKDVALGLAVAVVLAVVLAIFA